MLQWFDKILILLQSDILESCPVISLKDHHVVQEAAGVVAQLVRLQHRGQHLLGHRQEGAVADEPENLLLLVLDTDVLRLVVCGVILTQLLFIIYGPIHPEDYERQYNLY